MGSINTRFPVAGIRDGLLVVALGYPIAESGEEVTVYHRSARKKYEGYYVDSAVASRADEVAEDDLSSLGLTDHDEFVQYLTTYYRTGMAGRVPVTIYYLTPETENVHEDPRD